MRPMKFGEPGATSVALNKTLPWGTSAHRSFTSSLGPCEPHPSTLRWGKQTKEQKPALASAPRPPPPPRLQKGHEASGATESPMSPRLAHSLHCSKAQGSADKYTCCLPSRVGSPPPGTHRQGFLPRGRNVAEAWAAGARSRENAAPSRGPTFTCYANNTKTPPAGAAAAGPATLGRAANGRVGTHRSAGAASPEAARRPAEASPAPGAAGGTEPAGRRSRAARTPVQPEDNGTPSQRGACPRREPCAPPLRA